MRQAPIQQVITNPLFVLAFNSIYPSAEYRIRELSSNERLKHDDGDDDDDDEDDDDEDENAVDDDNSDEPDVASDDLDKGCGVNAVA